MSIAFNQIPLVINTPGYVVEFDASRATKGASIQPHSVLLVGQMLTGSGAASTVYAVKSGAEAIALFGAKSQLAQMVAAYKAQDSLTQVYAIGVVDGTTAASGSITVAGTATEAGATVLYIAGRRVSVSVTNGMTAAQWETAALAALALETDLPVTVAADAGTGVDFTATCKGTLGNQIAIGHSQLAGERVPAGLALTVTAMASGATDPSYTAAIAATAEDQYHTIVSGLCTSTVVGAFVTELESRWGPMRQIEGELFAAFADTRANLTTLGNSFNSFAFVLCGMEVSALMRAPWEVAAAAAAVSAQQTQIDPARACTGLTVAGFSSAKRGTGFTRAERDILLSDGVSTFVASQDGRMLVERFVTTYQTNSLSIPDTALRDLHPVVRTLAALRYSLRVRIGTRFARFKLADDGNVIPPGQPIVTPKIIRAEIIALFQDWQQLGWVENLEQFKAELFVERDQSDPNRCNAILPPDLINSFLVGAFQIQFRV